jgi:hypothetical protein
VTESPATNSLLTDIKTTGALITTLLYLLNL